MIKQQIDYTGKAQDMIFFDENQCVDCIINRFIYTSTGQA